MKKERLTLEEFAALIERLEAQSLKKGDGQILEAVLKKTLLIQQKYREGKITSKKQLRRLMAIARPEKSDD
ncbi:MAG: hypothetical protein IMZ61_07035 [Planctomycetes bacterium]|jgi:hypothetical protein|nr:hypothetical protein [Candidatus Bathyarchaeota archaeon]MBE3119081.1 hypothetical protein [Candidatus Atribacteria bacterium]MBE3143661.1 hypothetical protein [Planctomycetota bacterium]